MTHIDWTKYENHSRDDMFQLPLEARRDMAATIVSNITQIRKDAAETAILALQLEQIEAQTYDVPYPEFKARQFLPVDNSDGNWVENVSYQQWDMYGAAKLLANYGDDLELVNVTAKKFTNPVRGLGLAYSYSVTDLRRSLATGQSIDGMRANAVRRGIESAIDEIAAFGLPEVNMGGFLNNPNVPLTAPITGTWSTATPTQIVDDMNTLANAASSGTREIHVARRILLSTALYNQVSSTLIGNAADRTILSTFLQNHPTVTEVRPWHKLDLADASGTGPRAVAYDPDPTLLVMKVPQEFETFPPQERNLEFYVPAHARTAGTIMRYPFSVRYMDGL